MSVLIPVTSIFVIYILTYILLLPLSCCEDGGVGFLIPYMIFFLVFIMLISWKTREKRDMRLREIKRGMESVLKELEREKEDILRHYPSLQEQKIKVRFAIESYRLVEVLSATTFVVLIGLFFIITPDEQGFGTYRLLYFLLMMSILIPESLRVKKYTMQNKQNKRKPATLDLAFEREESHDIMQYKRV